MSDEAEITADMLETFRRCTFARRVFASYASLRAVLPPEEEGEWTVSVPYTGQPFDPEQQELVECGWDHEHCDVCHAKVTDGMAYWTNADPAAGQVDLCEACHPRVMALLGGPSDRPA